MLSTEMMIYLADEKELRQKYAAEINELRNSLLMGLLFDIADVFKVPMRTIQSGDQQEMTVFVRAVFFYIGRAKTHYTLKVLAQTVGKGNHFICMHHLRKIEGYIKHNDTDFLTLWNYYITNSKLFTLKDFPNAKN